VNYAEDEDPSQRAEDIQDHCDGKSEASQGVSETYPDQQIVKAETPFTQADVGGGYGSLQDSEILISITRKG
jgi:hypothetical protein